MLPHITSPITFHPEKSEIRADETNLALLWGMCHQRQFCFMFLPNAGLLLFSFPSGMILCYLLCSFHSSSCLASIKFRQAKSCTLGYPSPYTHPSCAVGILENAQIDGQNFFLFYEQEKNMKENHFVWEYYWHLC